jgi:hypothetical protein
MGVSRSEQGTYVLVMMRYIYTDTLGSAVLYTNCRESAGLVGVGTSPKPFEVGRFWRKVGLDCWLGCTLPRGL